MRPLLSGLRFCGLGFVVDRHQLQNFQLAFAIRRDHGGHIADLLANNGFADGRGGGDQALADVRLFAGDELVLDFLIFRDVVDQHGRAEGGAVARDVGQVDEGEFGHAFFELAEARVDEVLALLGHVVLGVLAEIAHSHGLLDFRGKFVGELVFEQLDFFEQLFLNMFRHQKLSCPEEFLLFGNGGNYARKQELPIRIARALHGAGKFPGIGDSGLEAERSASDFDYTMPVKGVEVARRASRKPCKINTAATWSTTARWVERGRPASCRWRWASAEVRRSSHRWTGRVKVVRRVSANAWVLAACGLRSPDMYSGLPMTMATQLNLRRRRPRDLRSCFRFLRTRVRTGCAVRPSSSETATPMRRSPKSRPR